MGSRNDKREVNKPGSGFSGCSGFSSSLLEESSELDDDEEDDDDSMGFGANGSVVETS
jgi:hypothetical protein